MDLSTQCSRLNRRILQLVAIGIVGSLWVVVVWVILVTYWVILETYWVILDWIRVILVLS